MVDPSRAVEEDGPVRVLVVEDDAIVAADVEDALSGMGYEVVDVVAKGEWALTATREHGPDLVLMDIRLAGEMDGVEAGDTILDEHGVPVVFLTAYADEDTRARVRATAPFGYLVKPFDERRLQTTLEVALMRHRLTSQLQAERARVEDRERTLSRILETAAEGILLTDDEGRFEYANPAAERILDLEASEIEERSYRDPRWRICGPEGGPFPDEKLPVSRVLAEEEAVRGVEHGIVRPDGTRVVLSVNAEPLTGPEGGLTGVVASLRDVTEKKRFEAELRERALHDYLTGLPNRALFRDRLGHALERSDGEGGGLAVLFVDLKRFRVVNDSLGHEAGDRVLAEVARRLEGIVEDADTVARAGGDEFTVLLEEVENEEDVTATAGRVSEVFARPVTLDERELAMEASIGVVFLSAERASGVDPSTLIRSAEAAGYRAKEMPGTRCVTTDPRDEGSGPARLERETRLREALSEGRLRTAFQPIFDLETGEIRGVEALARWRDPELGEIPPGGFIPLAEETGLIIPLGGQQLERASSRLLEDGLADPATGEPLRLHVNLSARQFEDPDLVDRTEAILSRTGFPPSRLCLEITESAAMRKPQAVQALTGVGVDLAIDDFGTRHSTLSQLRRLSVDALKIDRTFVDGLPGDEKDRAIVQTILTLGRTLRLRVVAEGIEGEEQLRQLRELGCDEAQGFHLAEPMTADRLRQLLSNDPAF